MTNNAPEEETYYNSESEAIETYIERYPEDFEEYKESDIYIQTTCEETFGKECHEETYNESKTSSKETSSN